MSQPFEKSADVKVEGGEVIVGCPDGEVSAWTPEAALATAQALGDKAVEAIVERGRTGAAKDR